MYLKQKMILLLLCTPLSDVLLSLQAQFFPYKLCKSAIL